MTSLCNAYPFISRVRERTARVCLLSLQNPCSGTSYPWAEGRGKAPWKLPTVWGARGEVSELSWVKARQSWWIEIGTLIKSDILISLFVALKDSEDPKTKFPESSRIPCTSGGACPGKADGLTVSGRPKFPSGTKICCSCPVYTNNLLSGARTCPSAPFYHLTDEGIRGVKYSPHVLAITKQPHSVGAWKHPTTKRLFIINSQRNDQRGRGESKNANYLLPGFPVRLGAPKSPPLPSAARTPCYPPGPLLSASKRSPHRQMESPGTEDNHVCALIMSRAGFPDESITASI